MTIVTKDILTIYLTIKNVHKVFKFPGIRAQTCNNPELLPGTHDINNKDVQVTNARDL